MARQAWSGPIVIEGEPTGDGRFIREGALTWRDLPLSLLYQREQPPMGIGNMNPHAGARIVGTITRIWRDDENPALIRGEGFIGSGEESQAFATDVEEGNVKGISVDMDSATSIFYDDDDPDAPAPGVYQEVESARIMGATACAFPAIMGAEIALLAIGDDEADEPHSFQDSGDGTCKVCGKTEDEHGEDGMPKPSDEGAAYHERPAVRAADAARRARDAMAHSDHDAMVAAAMAYPPESWFGDPHLAQPQALRITEQGEIFGHAATWQQQHTALRGRTAPRSASGYAYFRTGARRVRCDCGDGSWAEIPTGTITLGTSHFRDLHGDARAALDHYEHTGLAVADVAVGEDDHGIWVHGALRPDVPDDRVIELRGASLSGDWRWIGGRLELVALLAVNTPGFPVPRQTIHEQDGQPHAMVAAGVVPPDQRVPLIDLDALYRRMAALEDRLRLLDPLAERHARDRLGL